MKTRALVEIWWQWGKIKLEIWLWRKHKLWWKFDNDEKRACKCGWKFDDDKGALRWRWYEEQWNGSEKEAFWTMDHDDDYHDVHHHDYDHDDDSYRAIVWYLKHFPWNDDCMDLFAELFLIFSRFQLQSASLFEGKALRDKLPGFVCSVYCICICTCSVFVRNKLSEFVRLFVFALTRQRCY